MTVKEIDKTYVANTYARFDLQLVNGKGSLVYDEQGKEYIDQYINFLKCGGSRSPLDSLKVAGIDMTSPAVIEDAIAFFADTLAQFKALAEKLGMLKD